MLRALFSRRPVVVLPPQDEVPSAIPRAVRENDFCTTRDRKHYEGALGASFARDCRALGAGRKWLDGGAGECVALRTVAKKLRGDAPALTGLSFVVSDKAQSEAAALGVRLLTGAFEGHALEDIRGADGHGFDLVTDVFGLASYAADVGLVLNTYAELMRRDGHAYFYMGGAARKDLVEMPDGTALELLDWIALRAGDAFEAIDGRAFALTHRPAQPFPSLELVSLDEKDAPPARRRFRERSMPAVPLTRDKLALDYAA
jgi:hypothetical protein